MLLVTTLLRLALVAVALLPAQMLHAAAPTTTKLNRLLQEDSPYLRQHASNPVDWYPWGREAFEKARRENKPILLSVGYSTCHWCHVMERESFSADEIAAVLNTHFVAIKVDRERRPEIDERYMLATEILNRTGGWPNNVFLTPDLKPFAALTYLPRPQFKELMVEINRLWQTDPGSVIGKADQVANAISASMQARSEARTMTPALLQRLVTQATTDFDEFNGGIGVAPKFPQESLILFLLEQAERNVNERARTVALTTLDNMLLGGIRDHIGGGFHRYAIDPAWRIPHFEKMLYNQALIAQALVVAHRITGAARYRTALAELLDHVLRDMAMPRGAFATAFDAESTMPGGDKKEGAYYVWTPAELEAVLGKPESGLAARLLGISTDGNFDGASIPHQPDTISEIARSSGTTPPILAARLTAIKAKLNTARARRNPPLRDDKILTAWNALMIRAFADAAIALDEPRYRDAALKAAEFLWREHYVKPGGLRRFSFEGRTSLAATQPDYALLALAFTRLYDATAATTWLQRAEYLAAGMHQRFHDPDGGDYVMARTDDPLPPAKVRADHPLPSGNAVALELFAKLARRTLTSDHLQRAHSLLAALSGAAAKAPVSSGYTLKSADELLRGELGRVQYLGKGRVRVHLQASTSGEPVLEIIIADGWHINAHEPLEEHYIATELALLGADTRQHWTVAYPQPVVRKLRFADKPMALYEGRVLIPVQRAPSGQPPRALRFTAQACSDSICLAPETVVMTLRPSQ